MLVKKHTIYGYDLLKDTIGLNQRFPSKRPYHNPIPFHEIVSQMRKGIFGELEPNIVSVFLDNIVKRMVGENVVLTDGRVGEVVSL